MAATARNLGEDYLIVVSGLYFKDPHKELHKIGFILSLKNKTRVDYGDSAVSIAKVEVCKDWVFAYWVCV